ncbi:MAG: hypothetical protein U0228_08610 [Myxococcaceae bacterium]
MLPPNTSRGLELRVASPCSEKWEGMTGDERVRHCAKCRLNVFNLKEMTEQEIRALLLKSEGKVCGRVYRRPDGTVITKDCPTGVARLRRRAIAAITAAAALLLGMVGWRLGTSRECPTGPGASWFDRTVGVKFYEGREALRDTKTFGPIVNELWPQEVTMGAMVAMPPPPLPKGPGPQVLPEEAP